MTKDIDRENGIARTKSEALAREEKHYCTGELCKNGHKAIRHVKSGLCMECERERNRKRYEKKQAAKPQKTKKSDDPEHRKAMIKKWKIENPEKYKDSYRRSYEKKKATTKGKLEYVLSSGVRRGILKGSKYGRRTFDILGYSLESLMLHLEGTFRHGMTWDNYGKWHIDHIIPLSAFNYETPDDEDFKRAWALGNLQALWAIDNWTKNAKIEKPFQPSLLLRPANDNFTPKQSGLTNL